MRNKNADLVRAAMKNPQPAVRNAGVFQPLKRAEVIPQVSVASKEEGPNELDLATVVEVLRVGTYYPGRMGDPTQWKELRIVHNSEEFHCWLGDRSGYEGDDTWLSKECEDIEDIETEDWYVPDQTQLGYETITSGRKDCFRHVKDMLEELATEGSVTIR